ncbi:MAG TPA: c-type cytochrome [Bacteriovoracaceae bacterium]|nr:c-type cytochrome [Bacteriovoracaceae bacterium]
MKREPGMAYDTKALNKFFAIISVVFLLVTIWMIFDDYIRPWKAVQVKALDIERQKIQSKIKEIDGSTDGKKLKEVKARIAQAEKGLESRKGELEKADERIAEIQRKIYVQNMVNGVNGSQAAALQFQYEHALVVKHMQEAKKLKLNFESYKNKEIEGKDNLKGLQAQEAAVQNEIKKIQADKTAAEKDLKDMVGDKERMLASMSTVEKNPVWALRNAPFIDYLDPTVKIKQYVVENVTDDRYFQQVPKIDRCTTCHVFIDKPGYEDQQNPYKTHPKVDQLAVGANSAHPAKVFGCTSCHGGVGDRVNDFNSPAHVPQNAKQEKEWKKKYHWHEPHKVPQAMIPLQHTEGMCIKCHQGVEKIPMGDKLNSGRGLIEQYGCYACHKIEGWQHLEKPGPSLKKVTAKIPSKEFIKNWIWAPKSFNPKSKMPQFFDQPNNSTPEFRRRTVVEVNAMAEYIIKTAKESKPLQKYAGGDKAIGKELIETIGCVGCHMVEGIDDKWNKVGNRKGTYLTGLGSKVDPDWLVTWLKQPSHYDPTTVMPSFRLSDKEANDIASYLLSFKNEEFASLKFSPMEPDLRDRILVEDYFSTFETVTAAQAKLEKLTDAERTDELGKRSINKYGCYSCHDINGFEGDLPQIGPELTKEGSKPVEQFGFGQQHHVPHTRQGWLTQHLKNPRIWDVGVPKLFKDLNKMPNFYLSDQEVESMVGTLLGQVSDKVPLAGQKILNANEKVYEDGMKVANKYNCYGCHKIDGFGGKLSEAFEDQNYGPPYLVKEGHRVQTDWLYDFLKNVHPIRPYVKVRMPTFPFTTEELNKLVMGFQAGAHQATFEGDIKVVWEPGEKEAAQKIWNELACTTCHTVGFTKDDPQAPDLHYAKNRLRTTWIDAWISNPQSFLPYTSMPAFWDDGSGNLIPAVEGVLDNDPKRQIKAIRKLVQEFGNDFSPKPFPKNFPAE